MTKINFQLPLFEDKLVKESRRDGRKRWKTRNLFPQCSSLLLLNHLIQGVFNSNGSSSSNYREWQGLPGMEGTWHFPFIYAAPTASEDCLCVQPRLIVVVKPAPVPGLCYHWQSRRPSKNTWAPAAGVRSSSHPSSICNLSRVPSTARQWWCLWGFLLEASRTLSPDPVLGSTLCFQPH